MVKTLYTPILKFKQGEQVALQQLSDDIKPHILPLLAIMPKTEAQKFIQQVTKAWGPDYPFVIDYHPSVAIGKASNDFMSTILTEFKKQGLCCIPVVKSDSTKDYINILKEKRNSSGCGYAIRITDSDLDEFAQIIDKILKLLAVDSKDVDLIVDLGHLPRPSESIKMYTALINTLLNSIKSLTFRRIILCGGSFPEALKGTPQNQISQITRNEWQIWRNVIKKHMGIIFGDYGIDDPYQIEVQNFKMVPTIRYTFGDYWYIIRGKYDAQKPWDYPQFHGLSKVLVKEKGVYCGKDYSWGDKKIYECAEKPCTGSDNCNHGNLTSWAKIGTNHHLTYVVNQLSSLS